MTDNVVSLDEARLARLSKEIEDAIPAHCWEDELFVAALISVFGRYALGNGMSREKILEALTNIFGEPL